MPYDKKPVYIPRQKRLHGAFRGGFSAGYFNTVGSREGWTPRQQQPDEDIIQQRPEDFMDEQDHNEWGGPSAVSAAFQIGGDTKQPTLALLTGAVVPPANIGRQLLRALGWRESSSSAFVPSENTLDSDHEEQLYLSARRLRKIRLSQVKVEIPQPKLDTAGLGFERFANAPEFQRDREKRHKLQANHRRKVYRVADAVGGATKEQLAKHKDEEDHYVSYETENDFVGSKSVGGFALHEDEDDAYDEDGDDRNKDTGKVNIDQDNYDTVAYEHEYSSDEEHQKESSERKYQGSKGVAAVLGSVLSAWASAPEGNEKKQVLTSDGRPVLSGFVLGGTDSSFASSQRYAGPDLPEGYEVEPHVSGSEKRNPNDFALWKSSKPGEPAWDSPWGPGRPGWHIECSAVASDILGENLDIHSGGEDLKFPHHDNELAQSEACLGACCGGGSSNECHQWVNYFTHTGHLHIEGLKMSKSLKNFVTIREALEKNSPRLLRILFLMQGWDQPMNYSQQTTDDARSKETTFKAFFRQVEALARGDYLADEVGWRMGEHDRELSYALLAAQQKVHESLLDNFNTKEAMLALLQVISQANVYLRIPDVKPAVLTLKSIAMYVTQILKVFGVVRGSDDFGFETSGSDEAGGSSAVGSMIDALVSFRTKIRDEALSAVKNSKDDPTAAAKAIQAILETCDALRDEILPTVGIRLEDRPEGTLWNREDPATMMKELEEKKAREMELRQGKIEKKLVAKEKELAKLRDSLQVPDQMFRTDEFKEWDETGVPTVNADGTPVGAGQMKKKKKAMEKQMKMYDDLMSKADGNPQSLLDATEAEVKRLQEELAALSV